MAKISEVYKCALCGNIVEVLHGGNGTLVCCGQAMKHYVENEVDAATEKHIPVIECTNDGIKVSVGTVLHPMADDHYIEWIELIVDGKTQRQMLNPGDQPVAIFSGVKSDNVTARAYCNLHGLWKS